MHQAKCINSFSHLLRSHGYYLFVLCKSKIQKGTIKLLRTFFDDRNLYTLCWFHYDPSHQHFNRQHIRDLPTQFFSIKSYLPNRRAIFTTCTTYSPFSFHTPLTLNLFSTSFLIQGGHLFSICQICALLFSLPLLKMRNRWRRLSTLYFCDHQVPIQITVTPTEAMDTAYV